MIAPLQYRLTPADLDIVLAMVRTGTLAAAGARIGLDSSTVFRSLRRIERGLGQILFERSRSGYLALELARLLAEQAEQIETAVETARSAVLLLPEQASGTVRLTTTDTILHGLVAPALQALRSQHPALSFDLHTGNELASLTRRDADIAVRATSRPPPHLVGKHLGTVDVAIYAARNSGLRRFADIESLQPRWIAPDEALPEHPSVLWRKRHFPKVEPAYRVSSILSVMKLVSLGLGIGILPLFLAADRRDLVRLTDVIDDARSELWLLTHPESRHLRRVSIVYQHLSQAIRLAPGSLDNPGSAFES